MNIQRAPADHGGPSAWPLHPVAAPVAVFQPAPDPAGQAFEAWRAADLAAAQAEALVAERFGRYLRNAGPAPEDELVDAAKRLRHMALLLMVGAFGSMAPGLPPRVRPTAP
ncbi:hypothetical protein ACFPOE_05245 [Caenimonas terrae]|uniref:Uncharacterized protein n=1 Tax=Caenimonas terrae TaxID=696074 RepID=A0ABW0N8I1_9BURK